MVETGLSWSELLVIPITVLEHYRVLRVAREKARESLSQAEARKHGHR